MGWFSTNTEAGRMATLTYDEKKLFDRLDQAVGLATRAAKVVIEGGRALGTIREKQLYRDTVPTWEAYLERHGLTRRRADQLVAAAQALDAVAEAVQSKTGTVVPELDQLTERTARHLVGMDADSAAEAVIEAASSPEGVTAGSIRKAVAKRKKAKAAKVPRPRRFKVPGAVVVVTFNRKGSGSAIDALAAAHRQAEADLDSQADAA
jgi:hypothetical protein